MEIKSGPLGADVRYWQPAIWGAMTIARFLWAEMFKAYPFVITSGAEGKHRSGSRHYDGRAGDIRTKDPSGSWGLTGERRLEYRKELDRRLGDEFDVTISEPFWNVHIELDPKGPMR